MVGIGSLRLTPGLMAVTIRDSIWRAVMAFRSRSRDAVIHAGLRRRAGGACHTETRVSILSRIFGARRHATPQPTDEQVAAVDVPRMLDLARARGDRRPDNEIAAALLMGADLTAERHRDPELRQRAAAASVATRDWLVVRVGEDEAARLVSASLGPVGEDGSTARRARGDRTPRPTPRFGA